MGKRVLRNLCASNACTKAFSLGKYFNSRFQMVWPIHYFGSFKKIHLYAARVFTGAWVFRSLHVFRVQSEHSDECTKSIFMSELFQMEVSHGLGAGGLHSFHGNIMSRSKNSAD